MIHLDQSVDIRFRFACRKRGDVSGVAMVERSRFAGRTRGDISGLAMVELGKICDSRSVTQKDNTNYAHVMLIMGKNAMYLREYGNLTIVEFKVITEQNH